MSSKGPPGTEAAPTKSKELSESASKDRAQRTDEPRDSTALLVTLLPLLGATIYVVLRGEYVRTYSRFGVTPEDVGVDYFAVLTGAARILRGGNVERIPAWLAIPAVVAIFAITLIAVHKSLRRLAKFDRFRTGIFQPLAQWVSRASFGQLLLLDFSVILLLLVLIFQLVLRLDSSKAIDRICNGERIRPGNLNLLALQAYRLGDLRPKSQDLESSSAPHPTEGLMYLGHSDGFAILYAYKSRTTWRIPEGEFFLRIDPAAGSGSAVGSKRNRRECDQ